MKNIQLFTTPIVEGAPVEKYYGIVTANQVAGTGFFTDLTASFSDLFGGKSGAYRKAMNELCKEVTEQLKERAAELGANAVIGVSIDYDNISAKGMSMFMVSIQGTAVRIAKYENENEIPASIDNENEISWEELNFVYCKKQVRKKIESKDPISNEEWDFILKNKVDDLAPLLYQYFQECKKSSELYSLQYETWPLLGVANFGKYLRNLDYKEAIKYVYLNLDDFKDIINENKLFCASNILDLAKNGKIETAISLLGVGKASYSSEDLTGMQNLANYLRNLPDIGIKEEVKGGLFSSGGMKYICTCGTKNDISSEYCTECGKNIKGLTKEQQESINNFVALTETLNEILKQ